MSATPESTSPGILIIQSEALVARDIQSRLEQLGHRVTGLAHTAKQALAKAEELHPDLLLCDIHLNDEIDGIDVARAITEKLDIPVIFLTTHADKETVARAKLIAPYGFILKPFDNRELEINIEIALYKHGTEKTLRKTAGRFDATLRNISDGVIATDSEGKVFLVNSVAESLIKIDAGSAQGMSIVQLLELKSFDSSTPGVDLQSSVLGDSENLRSARQLLVRRNGAEVPVEISANLIGGEGARGDTVGMVVSLRDISQQISYESQIRRNAFYDLLTDLPNRTLFLDRVGQAIHRTKRADDYGFAVLFIDLDGFRAINEGLGHGAGDQLIVEVSRRIEAIISPADTLSRFGGDTFALLLENHLSLQEVVVTCAYIQEDFGAGFRIDNRSIDISCSVGIVLSHEHYDSPEDMIRDADTAMHRAKGEGKGGHTVFDQGMYTEALRYIEWGGEMKRALEERKFEMHYQPIVDTRTGKIHSLEALIRWNSSRFGQLSPAEFVPVAEKSGLILPIGGWILESVCEQIKYWKDRFQLELKVEVNLSGVQFGQVDLAAKIQQLLERIGVPARLLGLEITEGVAMRDIDLSIATLEQLRRLGLSVSIDDFGTGYSSLAYLKRYPINTLKIDRSFIADITLNKSDLAIAKSIIALARALDVNVLAEGVETVEQLKLLVGSGCSLMQGSYFSHALPSEEVVPFLEREQMLSQSEKRSRYIV